MLTSKFILKAEIIVYMGNALQRDKYIFLCWLQGENIYYNKPCERFEEDNLCNLYLSEKRTGEFLFSILLR